MSVEISENDIRRVVEAFYTEVQRDAVLAPIFATKIGPDDWDKHMSHITDFWSSIFLRTGRFNGNPMLKHAALNGLTPEHFTRWLDLFKTVSGRTLGAEQAEAMEVMATRIGKSLQMGLAVNFEKRGEMDHPFKEFGLFNTRRG